MKQQQPLVSVVMPVHNAEQFIKQAIESIAKQTYLNWELIIVNDHSSDRTKNVIMEFKDKRIIYYENNKWLGHANSANRALKLSRGELIAILDADDVTEAERLEMQVSEMVANPKLVIIGSWARVIDANGDQTALWRFPTQSKQLKAQMYIQFPIVHSSAMLRKSALEKEKKWCNKKFNPGEDYELFFRLSHWGDVAVIPQYLTGYRIHGQNMSLTNRSGYIKSLPILLQRELLLIGLDLSNSEVANLVYFLHPNLMQKHQIKTALFTLFVIHKQIASHFGLGQFDLMPWNVYVCKTVIYQLLSQIRPH